MTPDMMKQKQQAAERAAQRVESGMVVGLGHGSTAILALRCLAERMRSGHLRDILGAPCSLQDGPRQHRPGLQVWADP